MVAGPQRERGDLTRRPKAGAGRGVGKQLVDPEASSELLRDPG